MSTKFKETREPKYLIGRDFTLDEETHTYTLVNGMTIPSTTTLLVSQHLAPDFNVVMAKSEQTKENVLKARDKGTYTHALLENFVNSILNEGKGDEFLLVGYEEANFLKDSLRDICVKNNIKPSNMTLNAELPLIVKDIIPYAGTIDLIIRDKSTDKSYIIDFKTGYPQKEKEQWQLSLYKNLYEHNGMGKVEKIYTINSKTREITDIPFVERAEIEKMLTCAKEGRVYKDEKVNENVNSLPQSFFEKEKLLVEIQKEIREAEETSPTIKNYLELKDREKELKDGLKEDWTLPYGESITTPFNKITYSVSTILDSAKLKKDYKEVYDKCTKESTKFTITPLKSEKEKVKGSER